MAARLAAPKSKRSKASFGSPERRASVEEMKKIRESLELASERALQGLDGMILDMRAALVLVKPRTVGEKAMRAWLEKSPEKFMMKLEELEREQAEKRKVVVVEEEDDGTDRLMSILNEALGRK